MPVEAAMLEGFILRYIWRTNQVRHPSEDLNAKLRANVINALNR